MDAGSRSAAAQASRTRSNAALVSPRLWNGRLNSSAYRDPASMTYSAAQVVCCGKTPDELKRRADNIGREVDELREHGLAGTPDEIAAKIAEFASLGASRMYLQVLDLADLDHLELLAGLIPAVR